MHGDRADASAEKWLPLNTMCTSGSISPASISLHRHEVMLSMAISTRLEFFRKMQSHQDTAIAGQLFEMDVDSNSQSSKRKVCKDEATK